jgi:uncharacterized protein (PEP-CTERM system associated)
LKDVPVPPEPLAAARMKIPPVTSPRGAVWLVACAGIIGAGAWDPAPAAQWRIQPRVTVDETWSDNVNLSGSNAQHDFITQVTPGVVVRGQGGRVTLDLDYQLGLVHYARGNGSRRFDHRLQADGTAELLKQRFFVDFSSTAGLVNTSSTGVQAVDAVSAGGNTESFYTYSVNPYLVHHFGRYADGRVGVEHARVSNSDSASSTINGVSVSFTSGRVFTTLPWTLDAGITRTSNSTGNDAETRYLDGSVTYAFTRRYRVRLNAGYEDNDLVGVGGDASGLTWRVTGIWTPTPRTDVEVGYGKRYFGNSFSVDASHRSRRALFTARYSEESTTSAARQLESRLVAFEDPFGNALQTPGLEPLSVETNTVTISDQTLISRRFGGDVALQLRRGSALVGIFHDSRDIGTGQGSETVYGADGRWTHSLSRQTSASLTGNWQRSDYDSPSRRDTLWRLGLSLTHQIHRDVTGTIGYSRLDNSSTLSSNDYSENRVNARVSVLF